MTLPLLLLAAALAAPETDDNAHAPAARELIAPQPVDRPLATPRDDVHGAANVAQVAPGLWRSAQPSAPGFKNLQALGIRTVVNLRRLNSDRGALAGLGLRYFHIHFAPWHAEDEDVVAIYRVYAEGWSMKEAMQELPRFGFHSIWHNLRVYLEHLDVAALRAKVAAAPAPAVEVVP
jgi:hypothetical protein